MSKRAPYSACELYIDGADGLTVGDFITTAAGSAYLVQHVRQNTRRAERKHLKCLRWPISEVPPDARTFQITWYSRDKRSAR